MAKHGKIWRKSIEKGEKRETFLRKKAKGEKEKCIRFFCMHVFNIFAVQSEGKTR